MTKKTNFYRHGYLTGKGKKGTAWMAVDDGIINEALAKPEADGLQATFWEWAQGWQETNQWQYEVKDKILPPVLDKDGDINEDYLEAETQWFNGYVDAMMEHYKKMKKKK